MMTKINKKLRICILKKLSRQLSWICNPNKLGWRYVRIRRWPFFGSSCLKNGLVDMVGTYLHKCISSNGHKKRTNVEFRKITKFLFILFFVCLIEVNILESLSNTQRVRKVSSLIKKWKSTLGLESKLTNDEVFFTGKHLRKVVQEIGWKGEQGIKWFTGWTFSAILAHNI